MRKIRSSGTGLESRMEDILRKEGIQYEKQPALFGRPDFRISGTRVLVFCDSSFWHAKRKRETSGEAFKANRAFWVNKLARNRGRDDRVNRVLRGDGWSVLRFTDNDILKQPRSVTKRLREATNEANG
jgi:DNA mismatch endonuclease (patch repair protein)